MSRVPALCSFFFVLFAASAIAQRPQPLPQPVPLPPPVVAPADIPYIGPIKLKVDISNIVDRVETVHEEIPVARQQGVGAALSRVDSRRP